MSDRSRVRRSAAVATREQVLRLVDHALKGIDSQPIADRIDLHQAAAAVLEPFDNTAAEVQAHVAHLLREAERHQLKFRELLKS